MDESSCEKGENSMTQNSLKLHGKTPLKKKKGEEEGLGKGNGLEANQEINIPAQA